MSILDMTCWREFRVGDLFELTGVKQAKSQQLIPDDDNGIPYIVQSIKPNMCARFVERQYLIDNDEPLLEGNAIVLGVTLPAVSYQPVEFGASQVITARADFLNEYVGLFLVSVLNQEMWRFSYSQKPGIAAYSSLVIKLPATSDGEPDWDYMEQYMKAVMDRQTHVIDSLTRISKEKHPVDVSAWGEFRVGDLFENYHGSRLTVAERLDGDVPFLTAGFENQGVAGYIGNVVETYHNPITVDMFGNCFYHAGNYAGDDNVYFFVNDMISEFSKLFVTSVIAKKLTGLYSYNRQFRQGDVDDLCVRLPVTPGGEADWSYMEQYMRAVMDRQSHVVRCLARLRG